ncbi:uncharacterized protein LOC143160061 [Aptenodytes patagonicus]|uniref:uncharacterized protein LOC143160061 n=1 Tax=Aptenodytes patagonicus TaxID=9234 RepID=UPI003FA068BF
MVWEKFIFLLCECTILFQPAGSLNNQPNLAWALITGFTRIWNRTDQGLCVDLPTSASAGFKFAIIWLNFSRILNSKLEILSQKCIQNPHGKGKCLWGADPFPFQEYSGTTWYTPSPVAYLFPINRTWRAMWNATCWKQQLCKGTTSAAFTARKNWTFCPQEVKVPCNLGLDWTWCPQKVEIPCNLVRWWDSLPHGEPLDHEYNVPFSPSWCIQIPSKWGGYAHHDCSRYEYAWSFKHFLSSPDSIVDTREIDPLPYENTPLMNCSRTISCDSLSWDPIETWYVPELRTFIRDTCICWGFSVPGFKPGDPMCYGNIINQETALKCGVTLTHETKWNLAWEGEAELAESHDPSTCSTAKYPAPQGTFWACSNGKMYSHLHVHKMAGLRCAIGIPSMCPSKTFDFINSGYNRKKQDTQKPQSAPEWAVHGVQIPDYYTWGMTTSLMLENIFTPYVALKRHQFVLENLTWQMHVLSNWTSHTFGELNLQVPQVSKMALQNRLALDMLLVKEQGVCGVLNHTAGECCVTIHNATTTIEEACQKMQEITAKTE